MASDRGVLLTPKFQTHFVPNQIDGFRITVQLSQARLMPAKLFRYREIPIQPGQTARHGVFDGVCSPADLEEFPEDAPQTNADPPWYRRDSVDLVFRSRVEADEALGSIQADITILIDSLNAMDHLETLTPLWLGGGEAPIASSSSGSA